MKNSAFKKHVEQLSSEELAKIYQEKIVDNNFIDTEKITKHLIDQMRDRFAYLLNKLISPELIKFEDVFDIKNIREQYQTFENGKLSPETFAEIAQLSGIKIKKSVFRLIKEDLEKRFKAVKQLFYKTPKE